MVQFITKSETETIITGQKIARIFGPGTVAGFIGDLATGKTTIIKGIAETLGISGDVESPTFTLVNEYNGRIKVYHMDCYRETNIEGWLEIGIEDYFYSNAVSLVEWADRIKELLPDNAIIIKIEHDMDHRNHRRFTIQSITEIENKIKEILKIKE